MSLKKLLLIGISSFLIFIALYTPASLITNVINDNFSGVKFEQVDGTLWNGSAGRITINHRYVLNTATWTTCFWRLVTAEACVSIKGDYNNNEFEADVSITPSGSLIARNLLTILEDNTINNFSRLPIGRISGDIILDLDILRWSNNTMPEALGKIIWNKAAITLGNKTDLGTVTISLIESGEHPLSALITNQGGDLSIAGKTFINEDSSYNLELRLQLSDNVNNGLRSNIGMFAKKQSDGSFLLENSGNLKQLGII